MGRVAAAFRRAARGQRVTARRMYGGKYRSDRLLFCHHGTVVAHSYPENDTFNYYSLSRVRGAVSEARGSSRSCPKRQRMRASPSFASLHKTLASRASPNFSGRQTRHNVSSGLQPHSPARPRCRLDLHFCHHFCNQAVVEERCSALEVPLL